jgi:hypothetical protein
MAARIAFWYWYKGSDARHGRIRAIARDDAWSWKMWPRLCSGKRLPKSGWPEPPPVFTYEKPPRTVFEDLLWPIDDFYIVSSRLREFLEREAPGAAEYLPVTIEGPRCEEAPAYWIMNFIRVFDCLEEEESMNTDETGRRFIEVPVIDPARVPPDGVLGLLGGFTVARIMRADLKKKYDAAGFLGGFRHPIASIDRPESITWVKPVYKRTKPRSKKGK